MGCQTFNEKGSGALDFWQGRKTDINVPFGEEGCCILHGTWKVSQFINWLSAMWGCKQISSLVKFEFH